MSMLDRKLRRDLWRIKVQGLAVALVVGAGVAMFVMAIGTLNSLEETRDAYYQRTQFADVFGYVKRAPDELRARIERITGVRQADTRVVRDVNLDVPGMAAPAIGRLISLPKFGHTNLNETILRRGRMVRRDNAFEALANEAFADAHGLVPGDHVYAVMNGKRRRLTIVGMVLSPEYVYTIAPGEIVPDDRRFGVFWLGREPLAAAFDLDGAFNDVSLLLDRHGNEKAVIDQLDRLLEPYGGTGAFGRRDQISNWYLSGEITQLERMSLVMPPIFLAVAAFLLNIVVSRLVATERESIGLMKAFGYSDWAVGWHYLKLVLALTLLGVALGFLGGAWLGRGLTELYTEFFHFPFLYYVPSPWVFAVSAIVSVAAAVFGTIGAVIRVYRLPPAVAMSPPVPSRYRRTPIERARVLRLLRQTTRMILRHTIRWPLRAGLTVVGIALAVTVLIGVSFMLDAIEFLVDTQFQLAQRQDVTLTLVEPRSGRARYEIARLPGVQNIEPYRTVPSKITFRHRQRRVGIIGVAPGAELNRLLDVRQRPVSPAPEGLTMSTKLAELLEVAIGDSVIVAVLEGRRPVVEVPVAALFEEYIGASAYMDLDALNRMMGEGAVISGAYLQSDQRREADLYRYLKKTPVVAGVALHGEMLKTFRETMTHHLVLMTTFNILFACCIAFGVVYNSARIALSERAREFATLRVMGFTKAEVAYVLLGQMGFFTLVAIPLGCLFGYGLAALFAVSLDTEFYRIPLVVAPATYGYAGVVVGLAALASAVLVSWRISRLDLIAALKTRE